MANGKSSINVEIDAGIKEIAAQIFKRMGLDQTTAIEMFYRQTIAERRLPFQPAVAPPTLDEQLSEALLKRSSEADVEVDSNGNIVIDKDKHPDLYEWAANG
ncbi:MAG: type II toxin-antitoxin system RelB/DinJ family antitoxin [Oscillospiraceae bacterium]|nr:type II toxin-antitoxin system RelB/DinJ family antitoxin [Oscillospiraceae bacterium]